MMSRNMHVNSHHICFSSFKTFSRQISCHTYSFATVNQPLSLWMLI